MKKVIKSALSVIGITPIAIATVLPAASIGRDAYAHEISTIDFAISQDLSNPGSYSGGQTLATAPTRLSDSKAFDFTELSLTVKEIPLPEPEPEPEPEPTLDEPEQSSQTITATPEPQKPTSSSGLYTLGDLMFQGVIHWEGLKFTYYSQSVLPGGALSIPGRHVNSGGYVSDGDGFIVLAGSAPLGTVYNTPFGYPGKIYDRGTVGNHLDVYTM